MTADEWGVEDGWWDQRGQWRPAHPDTITFVRDALAAASASGRHQGSPSWFVRAGTRPELSGPAELTLEDGETRAVSGRLPGDLPPGYHQLCTTTSEEPVRLVVVPHRAPPLGIRRWGVTVQLFSLLSERTRGMGDLGDLEAVAAWLASRGGSVIGLNPLGEALPVTPREPSPYTPSSRRHLDPIWLDVGSRRAPADLIDRDEVWATTRAALASTPMPPPIEVNLHAVFNALVERFGTGWRSWPAEFRRPDDPAVVRFAADHPEAVAFWAGAQRAVEERYALARQRLTEFGVALMGDLPVGIDPAGFDAWVDQDALLDGLTVGAPPDPFSPHGQNWALPVMDPWALRASGYRAFIEVLRANLARCDGLRVDHVMGWFRLFVIPDGAEPAEGTYLRYRADELVDLAVLEATRAGAFLVGEDLGTVEPGVRETLAARGIAGTRVALFDPHPDQWPPSSLGALTTHDLPTVEGVLSGSDPMNDPSLRSALEDFAGGFDPSEPPVVTLHRALGASGSDLVLAAMEDVVGSRLRVNLPGTTDAYPNWKLPLPVTVEGLADHPTAVAVTAALAQARPTEGRSASAAPRGGGLGDHPLDAKGLE
jgi:4-alpha-glucanotransferase